MHHLMTKIVMQIREPAPKKTFCFKQCLKHVFNALFFKNWFVFCCILELVLIENTKIVMLIFNYNDTMSSSLLCKNK